MRSWTLYLSMLISVLLHGLVPVFLLVLAKVTFERELPEERRPIQVRVLVPDVAEGALHEAGLSGLTSRKTPETPTLVREDKTAPEERSTPPVLTPSAEDSIEREQPLEPAPPAIALLDVEVPDEERAPPVLTPLAEDPVARVLPEAVPPPALVPIEPDEKPREVSPPLEAPEDQELSSFEVPPTPSEASLSSEVTPPRSLAELSTKEIIERYATEEPPSREEPEESQPDLASIGKGEVEDLSLDTPDPLFQTYFAKIRLKIQRELHYPSEAERQQIQGQSLVRFVLVASGDVAKLRVLDPSGHPILDEASISAIRNASPFGPFPDNIRAKWRQLPIRAKFRFGQ